MNILKFSSNSKVMIISPHPDDTCFAIGGIILKHTDQMDFINYDVFSNKIYNINKTSSENIKRYILEEEDKAMMELGLHNLYLDYEEAYLRLKCKLSDIMGKKIEKDEILNNPIFYSLSISIKAIIFEHNPDCLIIPMGCGWHVDHLLVKYCILELISKENIEVRLFFYEDMPYSCNKIWYKDALDELKRDFVLEEYIINIDDYLEKKLNIMNIYETQLKKRDIRLIKEYIQNILPGCACERIWEAFKKGYN